jgi:ASCH domain
LPPGRRGEALLTVRQPWASAILVAGKDVENRTRSTNYRGRLWIHAGRATAQAESDHWARERGVWIPDEPLPRGVILGCVELVDVVRDSDSPWAAPDHWHWLLRWPMLLARPVELKGSLGLRFIRPPEGTLRPGLRKRRSALRRTS